MKKGVIKNLYLAIGILMCSFCFLPAKVKATTAEDFRYTENDGEITITGLKSDKGSVEEDTIIPNEIDGKPVTAIGDNAFYGCGYMGKLTIPESVTTIGDYAFWECSGFTQEISG